MTSVQNLLQLLNGNKQRLLLLFLCIFSILSCTGSKKSSGYVPGFGVTGDQPSVGTIKDSAVKKKNNIKINDTLDLIYPETKKALYKIAYLLPFELNNLNSTDENLPGNVSRAAVEFYMGSLVAMENTTALLAPDIKFELKFLDTENSDNQIKSNLIKELDIYQPDLIIGPFMPSEIKVVSAYSKKNKIPTVCPVSYVADCIKSNPYLVSEKPSLLTQLNSLRNFAQKNYPDYKIILFGSNKKENDSSLILLKKIDSVFSHKTQAVVINENNWNSAPYSKFINNGKYLFYIPLANEFVVNSIVSSLMSAGKTDDLVVVAPYKWLELSSVDISYMLSLNIHFVADHYINYKDTATAGFITAYRNKYNTEPTKYSFHGYEVSVFYGNALKFFGKYFQKEFFLEMIPDLYKAYYNDEKTRKYSGFERVNLKYLKFEDYELVEEKIQ